MPQSTIYPLADRVLGGTLQQRLVDARNGGESYDDIARGLHAEGIAVSGETVRKWCLELDIETERAS